MKSVNFIDMNQVININPQVLSGMPVFYGTRVPVKALFDYIETGESIDQFLEDFPSVKREQAVKLLDLAKQLLMSSTTILHETAA